MAALSGQATQAATTTTAQPVITPIAKPAATAQATTAAPIANPLAGSAMPDALGGNVPGGVVKNIAPIPSALNPFIARDLDWSSDYISGLIYGDFGVGKTYLVGSAVFVPDYCDVLYISLEGGEKSFKQLARDGKARGIDITKFILVVPVQTYKQYSNIYEFLKLHVKFRDANDTVNLRRLEAQIRGYDKATMANDALLAELIPEPKKFRTVITDSLTEAQKYCMYQLLGIDPLTQKIDSEPDSAQWADWGRSREMVQFLVRRFRDLPFNSWFICGQDTDQDTAKKWFYTPLLPGKLAGDVRGLVDTVGYYATIPQEGSKIIRRLFLVGGAYGNTNIAAKHRFGSNLKSAFVDNPTMETIYKLDND